MPLARFVDVGSAGIIRDQFASELPQTAWSDGQNILFKRGYATKAPGYASSLGTPSVAPYGLFYAPSVTTRFMVYPGLAKCYATDGTTHTNITRQLTGADDDYTGSATDKWVGGILSGILVMTNGVNPPQSWAPDAANDCENLTAWPASTTCRSIRPFKQFLVALDVTKTGTRYPYLVKWSHAADPGAVPDSWDETSAIKDAGEQDLADTYGEVIDGGAIGDVFLIWKQNATYAMRYVGPPFIFSFQKITEQSGILARNCWCETPMGLVVLTFGDVVLQVGDQAPKSIIDTRNRKWLFDNINSSAYSNAFVVHNEDESEVMVCFPATGSTWCDTALVWHYTSDTWGVRSLPSVSAGVTGYASSSSSVLWSSLSSTDWTTIAAAWDADAFSLAQPLTIMSSPTNTKLYSFDNLETADGVAQTTMVERSGLVFDQPEAVKFIRAIRPRIDGTVGDTVSVYVGAAMEADEALTWSGPYTYTIGSTLKVDTRATGRYIGVRFTSTGSSTWRLRSWDVDLEILGAY